MSSNSSSSESEEETSTKFYAERLERLAKLKMVEDEKNTENKPVKKSNYKIGKDKKSPPWQKQGHSSEAKGAFDENATKFEHNTNSKYAKKKNGEKNTNERPHGDDSNTKFDKKEKGGNKPYRDRRMSDASTCSTSSKPNQHWNVRSQMPSYNGGAGQGPYSQNYPITNGAGVNGFNFNQGPMNVTQYQANYQANIPLLPPLPQQQQQQQAPLTPDPAQFICNAFRDLRDMNFDLIKRVNYMHGSLQALHKNNVSTDAPSKLTKEFKSFEEKFGTLNDALQCLQLSVDAKVEDSTSKVLNNQSDVAVLKIQVDELTTMVQVCRDNGCGALQDIRSQDGKLQLLQADMNELKSDMKALTVEMNEVKKAMKTLDSQTNTCSICYVNRLSTCVIPCGHLFCTTCAENERRQDGQCPLCRQLIMNLQRAFFP